MRRLIQIQRSARDTWQSGCGCQRPARTWLAVLAILFGVCGAAGCAVRARPVVADRPVTLNGHPLRLHFANAQPSAVNDARPLLVFATGDAGMHRKDLDAYRHLVALGYPIVGFDAHDYVTHLGHETVTTPARLAADYERIIDTARQVLHLSAAHPVVLVGVSRGAGLSVVAAGQRGLRESIAGVVAVALTQEEEYVRWYRRLRGERAGQPWRHAHRRDSVHARQLPACCRRARLVRTRHVPSPVSGDRRAQSQFQGGAITALRRDANRARVGGPPPPA